LSGDTIFDEPHYLALERLAAKALAENHSERALLLSDRRCRIDPPPQPHCYLLRAEACFRLGYKSYGLDDLEQVLGTKPDDIEANRRMLAWSKGNRQLAAARALIKTEHNTDILRQAITVLSQDDDMPHASINGFDQTIEGWVTWSQGSVAEVTIRSENEVISSLIEPDPFHALGSERNRAASFVLARPRSHEPQLASISIGGRIFQTLRLPGNEPLPRIATQDFEPSLEPPGLTIIVPVYADYKATRSCIESLIKATKNSPERSIVLVNDATPETKIKSYLDGIACQPGVTLLTNKLNLGFVGSINRALHQVPCGDVILLNSDTVVPPGFCDRLKAAAESADDIGTVNPLSNNGEFSSFPRPNQINDLGTLREIIALDRVAAQANENLVVDLPSGIGFCLYIKRSCLETVGFLSEKYQRGYLEDVDFCLRARAAGFRSVCAASVYVGHVGSRSFRSEKQALVVHNLEVLDLRFPAYRNECLGFESADPLKPARAAIERRLPYHGRQPRLIVSGESTISEVAKRRADDLVSQGKHCMLLVICSARSGPLAVLNDAAGGVPQNLTLDLSQPAELEFLDDFLRRAGIEAIELVDPASVPPCLMDLLFDGRVPYEVLIADAGLLGPCAVPQEASDAGLERARRGPAHQRRSSFPDDCGSRSWRDRWHAVAANAKRILVPGQIAQAFAARHFPELKTSILKEFDAVESSPRDIRASQPGKLAILALRTTSEEFDAIRSLAQAIAGLKADLEIVVVGATIDDLGLMHLPNVFVTGKLNGFDFDRLLVQYQVQFILAGIGRPLFGHPMEREAVKSGLPIAHFDWSFGRYQPSPTNLAINPAITTGNIAERLVRWIEKR
jgi:GT2 family glycosyltransferase